MGFPVAPRGARVFLRPAIGNLALVYALPHPLMRCCMHALYAARCRVGDRAPEARRLCGLDLVDRRRVGCAWQSVTAGRGWAWTLVLSPLRCRSHL